MADFSNVKEGDNLLVINGGWSSYTSVHKVERLTKTQIITQSDRFNKLSGRIVGDQYSKYILKIATQGDINKIKKDRKISLTLSELVKLTKVNSETMIKNLADIIEKASDLRELIGGKHE